MRAIIARFAVAVLCAGALVGSADTGWADTHHRSSVSQHEFRARIAGCNARRAAVKSKLTATRRSLSTTRADLVSARSALSTARSDLAAKDKRIAELEALLAEATGTPTTPPGPSPSDPTPDPAPAPSPAPAPAPTSMRYGVSATSGSFNTGYLQQVKESEATVGYYYGQDPRWSAVSETPEGDDLWLQTKATTKAAYVAMLASFPAKRTGKVYLHYFNEPEDQIERGDFTLAQWQQRTDWLYEAIKESGRSYVVPSVEIMYWDLVLTNKGKAGPARLIDNYLRPGVKAVGLSAYAEKKVSNGHEVASTSPTVMPATIGAWSRKTGLPVSVITGWAVADSYLTDPVTLANRVSWTKTAAANLELAGVSHMMWFDIPWSNGDYRLRSDPRLLQAWRDLTP